MPKTHHAIAREIDEVLSARSKGNRSAVNKTRQVVSTHGEKPTVTLGTFETVRRPETSAGIIVNYPNGTSSLVGHVVKEPNGYVILLQSKNYRVQNLQAVQRHLQRWLHARYP